MTNKIEYDQLINGINNHNISEVIFSVNGYAHYRRCEIKLVKEEKRGNDIYLILIKLTSDCSEDVGFYKKFNESYKLFKMGNKGSFTLKQLWNDIEIQNLTYFSNPV